MVYKTCINDHRPEIFHRDDDRSSGLTHQTPSTSHYWRSISTEMWSTHGHGQLLRFPSLQVQAIHEPDMQAFASTLIPSRWAPGNPSPSYHNSRRMPHPGIVESLTGSWGKLSYIKSTAEILFRSPSSFPMENPLFWHFIPFWKGVWLTQARRRPWLVMVRAW